MENYVQQLLADIITATGNIDLPYVDSGIDIFDMPTDEEEDRNAPVRELEEWTGISAEMLPPAEMLNDQQIEQLPVP